MKYTKIPTETFDRIQLNAGVLVTDFDPEKGSVEDGKILGPTTGGISVELTPEFVDFGEDIDNCPKNMLELKQLDSWEAKISGTFVGMTAEIAKLTIGAAEINEDKIVPRRDVLTTDFSDIWWIGDYGSSHDEKTGGCIAVHLMNALSTGGFKIQTSDKEKGNFDFEFTGHVSMSAQDVVPMEIYVKDKTKDASAEGLAAKEPVAVAVK